jgi:hypothetical protein
MRDYNQHVRLLPPSLGWLHNQSLLGRRSRHCHGITIITNHKRTTLRSGSDPRWSAAGFLPCLSLCPKPALSEVLCSNPALNEVDGCVCGEDLFPFSGQPWLPSFFRRCDSLASLFTSDYNRSVRQRSGVPATPCPARARVCSLTNQIHEFPNSPGGSGDRAKLDLFRNKVCLLRFLGRAELQLGIPVLSSNPEPAFAGDTEFCSTTLKRSKYIKYVKYVRNLATPHNLSS